MRQYMKGAIVAGLVFILAGCQPQAASREYEVNGVVLAVDPASKTLELDHEEIPGYMKAMKMKYPVADAKLLDGFKVGDSVRGKPSSSVISNAAGARAGPRTDSYPAWDRVIARVK